MKIFESRSENETIEIAAEFAKSLKSGDVVALGGDLGAGKTAFVKGVSKALLAKDAVSSPTFSLVNQYDGKLTIYHFDAYRLQNIRPEDCDFFDDYLFSDGVCLIEWAENIKEILPRGYIDIKIEKNPELGQEYRKITIR